MDSISPFAKFVDFIQSPWSPHVNPWIPCIPWTPQGLPGGLRSMLFSAVRNRYVIVTSSLPLLLHHSDKFVNRKVFRNKNGAATDRIYSPWSGYYVQNSLCSSPNVNFFIGSDRIGNEKYCNKDINRY